MMELAVSQVPRLMVSVAGKNDHQFLRVWLTSWVPSIAIQYAEMQDSPQYAIHVHSVHV